MDVNDKVYDKGGAVYNVRASGFSVTGTGADDSSALDALLNSTIPTSGGVAYFPPDGYAIDSDLTVPAHVALQFGYGAELVLGSGVTVTINSPFANGLYKVFDASSPGSKVVFADGTVDAVKPEWFGLSPTASPAHNVRALRAAYDALPPNHATIELSEGTFDFGTPPQDVPLGTEAHGARCVLRIHRDNVAIRGQGMEHTVLVFDTTGGSVFGWGSVPYDFFNYNMHADGSPIVTGGLDHQFVSDLTVRDVATDNDLHNACGSAFNGIVIKNCEVRNLELLNGKGNGPFTMIGDAPNPTTRGSGDLVMENIWCRSENRAAGLFCNGDWINVAAFGRITLRQIHVPPSDGCDRHAIELGTGTGELYIEDSLIDMNGHGLACVGSFTIIDRGVIRGNTFLNWTNTSSAIPINPDAPTQPVNNLTVESNVFAGPSGIAAIATDAGVLHDHRYVNNTFACLLPILINNIPTGQTVIADNTSTVASQLILTSGNPAFVNASDTLVIARNTITSASPQRVLDFSTWTNAKDNRVRGLHTNVLSNAITGQIDGQALIAQTLSTSVAVGSLSRLYEATVLGVRPGDRITLAPRADGANAPPSGVMLFGFAVIGPQTPDVSPSSSGSLPSGTYYYSVTAIDATGETIASIEVPCTVTGPTGSVTLTFPVVPGASDYRVYRSSPGNPTVYYSTSGSNVFTDTGSSATSGSPPADLVRWYFQNNSAAPYGGSGVLHVLVSAQRQ